MNREQYRTAMLAYARSILGADYIWGAEERDKSDCSGVPEGGTNEFAHGRFPGRQTAKEWGRILPHTDTPAVGDLCVWGADWDHVYHIAVVEYLKGDRVGTIGAHGGNHTTTTVAKARAKGACVKRLEVSRSKLLGFLTWPNDGATPKHDHKRTMFPDRDGKEPPDEWV